MLLTQLCTMPMSNKQMLYGTKKWVKANTKKIGKRKRKKSVGTQ